LDRIAIEERIYDWTWTTGAYGDFFVKLQGEPGPGVVTVEDDEHPVNISRVDHNGILVGFYSTPDGVNSQRTDPQDIIPPWKYVHFRLLGGVKRRRDLLERLGCVSEVSRLIQALRPSGRKDVCWEIVAPAGCYRPSCVCLDLTETCGRP
jgi:hypothetical protein